jgi:putative ABC transport system permease protein
MIPIIATNLVRRLTRTLFTAAGIAVGIATIVALLSFTQGLKQTAAGLAHLGGSGLGVFQANVSDPTASILPESLVGRLAAEPYVARATPLVLMIEGIKHEPGAVTFGADPHGFFARSLVIVSGARPTSPETEALVGGRLAAQLHLSRGEQLTVSGRRYRIAGVYHSGILFEDSGAVLSLAQAQALAGRPAEETDVVVDLSPDAHAGAATKAIERDFPGTQVISDPQQALRAGANSTLISKAILVIVVMALIVGAIGVANTMAMSILERQAELGLLSTVGWSPRRVATLVMGEGIAVSMLGAVAGLLFGVLGGDLLVRALGVSAYVSPSVTAWGLGRGLLVGFVIGVLGGIYPAWRVTHMQPLKVLAGT